MLSICGMLLVYSSIIIPVQLCMWDYDDQCNMFPTLYFDIIVDSFFVVNGKWLKFSTQEIYNSRAALVPRGYYIQRSSIIAGRAVEWDKMECLTSECACEDMKCLDSHPQPTSHSFAQSHPHIASFLHRVRKGSRDLWIYFVYHWYARPADIWMICVSINAPGCRSTLSCSSSSASTTRTCNTVTTYTVYCCLKSSLRPVSGSTASRAFRSHTWTFTSIRCWNEGKRYKVPFADRHREELWKLYTGEDIYSASEAAHRLVISKKDADGCPRNLVVSLASNHRLFLQSSIYRLILPSC